MNSVVALALLLPSRFELRPLAPASPQIQISDSVDLDGIQKPDDLFPGYSCFRTIRVAFPNRKRTETRIHVCADSPSLKPDLDWASRAAARVWELHYVNLGLDLPTMVENQTLHLMLRSDGQAGGEQVLTRPPGNESEYPWCVVYLYQVPTLTQGPERWREIAHEYGHAVLPAWGPYSGPEEYSNGDLGERLATAWIYDALRDGSAEPSDAAGSTAQDLMGYMQQKVWAESARFALIGPDDLDGTGPTAYWAGVRLATFCQQTLPPSVFRRALGLGGAGSARNFAEGVVEAVSEQPRLQLKVLPGLQGKAAWYPVGSLRPLGKVLARQPGWAKLVASGPTITLTKS